ncbi:diguanylate cyclase [Pseudoalteromonas sp. meg-B1]|uniref:sensor domain-containing diguanylate cyclase n=1 Tax=Pseudoalteromonas sp. meg-B1 TaxID=2203192 RepID=UPI000D6F4E59|nr:diguanylate cyclase [Pseudoalteromonas sp. meg-B1]PWS56700.1 diguanylate cyclase [Pseudoalteromonas sp. meg-B1]
MRYTFNFICCLLFQTISFSAFAVALNQNDSLQLKSAMWHQVDLAKPTQGEQLVNAYHNVSTPVTSLYSAHGSAIAKISLTTTSAGRWYIIPQINYLDSGVAFYQDTSGIREIADFSQNSVTQSAIVMHSQAFELQLEANSHGVLWLYINAKHFAKPVSINVIPQSAFVKLQFYINSLSLVSITIMLTLACMALIMFFKTQHRVALFCAGYIGLHGIGWAFAAGIVALLFNYHAINTHYFGMYIFAFAIACASSFAYYLFNFDQHTRTGISRFLKYFSITAFACGFLNLFLPFHWVFYLAHFLAAIWVYLSLKLGFTMLGMKDFRAKYFLTGNLVYSLSLVIFILSHLNLIEISSPELWVLIALAIDCICILLSLSEWLKIKQNNYIKALELSRRDPLTKVGNRLQLQEILDNLDNFYLIVFIDCDNIKSVNDHLGHAHGDKLLIEVTRLIQNALADIGEVCRTGGDEFICVCNVQSAQQLAQLILSINESLNYIHQQVQKHWPLSGVSYGLASSEECNDYKACLTLADQRMYTLKHQRKNKRQVQSQHA